MQQLHLSDLYSSQQDKSQSDNGVDRHHVGSFCFNQSVTAALGSMTKTDKMEKWYIKTFILPEFCPGDSDEPSRRLVVSALNNAQRHILKFNIPLHSFIQFISTTTHAQKHGSNWMDFNSKQSTITPSLGNCILRTSDF